VHQDEGRSRDRPAVLAGFVGENFVEGRRHFSVAPRGLKAWSLERRKPRLCSAAGYRPSCSAWRRRIRLADRALDALHEGGHAFIAFAPELVGAGQDTEALLADLLPPFVAYLRKIVGEDEVYRAIRRDARR